MGNQGERRRIGVAWVALLALVVLAGVGGGAVLLLRDGGLPGTSSPADQGPRLVSVPDRPPLLEVRLDAPAPTPAGLAAVVAQALTSPALGGQLAAAVIDVDSGAILLDRRGGADVTPASTTKIPTAVAALTVLDPDRRLVTRVVQGPVPGQVVLVGGGDPTLVGNRAQPGYPERATVAALAAQVQLALAGSPVTSVVVDASLYTGPQAGPEWSPGYVTGGDVAPVGPLMVDGARTSGVEGPRDPQPALAAGRALATALGVPAIPVVAGTAAAEALQLGAVESPTVAQLVELMLTRSDNDIAEALVRQVALARGEPASFAGAAAAVDRVLDEVAPAAGPGGFALLDGSGLSRGDRVQPLALARLIALVAQDGLAADAADVARSAAPSARSGPDPSASTAGGSAAPGAAARQPGRLGPVLTGLPVAGFDGTLARRFRDGPALAAAGSVRGKTGTLNGVSALAGLVHTADGRLLAFDLTADAVPLGGNAAAQTALDALAAALAGCGCH